ncbi:MAG: cysteine synthase family protein [Planctomycetota bacterium]|jgi:cysteine synthase B|nr:cysteine synthase family protein [Planctomycetota bacterium]
MSHVIEERHQQFHDLVPSLNLIGNTPLIEILALRNEFPNFRVFAKQEWRNPGGSLKDRPVKRMLLEAILDGSLTKDRTILDSSSGNAGIAYAMIGKALGYKVKLYVPANASKERKDRLAAHGAEVIYTDAVEGYDHALRSCHAEAHANPDKYFFSNQYANNNNWMAHYHGTAEEILTQTDGKLTHFVAGVGTGGTITGCGRRLKDHNPNIKVISILPEVFPGIEGLKPLESPTDIRPEILDDSVIDEWVPVTAEDAYDMCHLMAKHGLFVGQSSGAYLAGVRKVAEKYQDGICATISCDIGERYFSAALWQQ